MASPEAALPTALSALLAPVLNLPSFGFGLVDGLVELGGVARDANYQACESRHALSVMPHKASASEGHAPKGHYQSTHVGILPFYRIREMGFPKLLTGRILGSILWLTQTTNTKEPAMSYHDDYIRMQIDNEFEAECDAKDDLAHADDPRPCTSCKADLPRASWRWSMTRNTAASTSRMQLEDSG